MEADFGFTVGAGDGSTGGGGDDPFKVGAPADPLDAKIDGYLMRHPEGVSQKAVRKAVRGAGVRSLVARLKVVGTLGPDKLWRCATDALSPPPEQAVPESQKPLVGNSGTGGAVPAVPVNGNLGRNRYGNRFGNRFPPYRGTASGNRFREPVPGTGSRGPCRYENPSPYPSTGGCKGDALLRR